MSGALLMALALPAPAQQPDVLTPACRAPHGDIASTASLPRVSAALQRQGHIRVLAIGSSSTVGIGASSPQATYPAQFEEIIEKVLKGIDLLVVNRGVSGEVAAATAERLKAEVAELKPDLVLWQVGTNDALARVPVAEFEARLRDTVRWVKDAGADLVLVGLQFTPRYARDEHYAAIRRAVQGVATSENVLLVRRYAAMQFIAQTKEKFEMLSADALHLNDLGYHCMAQYVAHAVVTSSFLRRSAAATP
jgi:lysophospholipase L1-like esterase